ncbi:MAG: amidohydrolase family protein [Gemmatimonadaceae bacterium]|nr:amidohydrolase family protein [Gemmatimonadaceae bacterium]
MIARIVAAAALAATTTLPLPAQVVAITGARVFPVNGPPVDNATVVITNGRISAVGAGVAVPAGARRIDGTGKWVTPGIFNATTSLGVSEIGQIPGSYDAGAQGTGDGVTASFRVWEGFNPASPLLQVTRNDGITTVGIIPSGSLVGGQGAVVALRNGSLADVLMRGPAAMFADLNARGARIGAARAEVYARLRDVFDDARALPTLRAGYERNASRPLAAGLADLRALQPVLAGTLPLVVDADRATDIEEALTLARQYGLRIAVGSATEGWKVADQLGAAKAFVLVGALNNIPRDFSSLGARQDNAALLHAAGARVIISGGTDAFNARNVRFEAGVAVAFGLPWDAALRAVTLTPAELYGVANRVGSLENGKDATLVVWSGDPFEPSTRAEHVFVQGAEVQGPSRQDELMRRYRTVPADYRKP